MIKRKLKPSEIDGILDGWNVATLKDIAVVNEKTIDKKYPYSEIEYIDIASVDNGRILEIRSLLKSEAPSRAQRIVRNNDILLSTVRPNLKHFAFMETANPNTIASTGFAVISSKTIDSRFLYYYLTTDKYTDYLSAIADAHTSTYPAFNPDILENSEILCPPEGEQRAIAKILSDLDAKIELNYQINKILESMAQALFKRWFMDFDFPDDHGRPYRSSGGKMVDSEQGEIPIGWRIGRVSDFASLSRNSVNPSDHSGEIFYHYSLPAFDEKRMPIQEKGEAIKSNKFIVPLGCVLLSKLNPRIPRIWLPTVQGEYRSIASTEFLVVISKKMVCREFLFCLFSSNHFLEVFSGLVTGTSGSHQRVRPENLLDIDIVVPSGEMIELFSLKVKTLFEKTSHNLYESSNLASLRDALLPRLMSGSMRVL